MILLAAYLLYVARTYKAPGIKSIIPPMSVPTIVFVLIIVLSLAVLVKAIREYRQMKQTPQEKEASMDPRIPITIGAIIVYAMLWKVVGFCLSSFLFFTAESKLLNRKSSWVKCVILAVAVTALIRIVFGEFFGVNLPEPIFEFLS